jgi:CRP-like cAMP-binding protein
MDSKNVFAAYLKNDSTLKQEEIELICSFFEEEILEREKPLLMAGSKYKKIVFVVEGILRVFIIDKHGEEVVKNFIEPKSFFADIESLEKNQNSMINVSAVTDCAILTLSKSDAGNLVQQLPKWEYLMKVGAMQAMNDMIRKQEFLHIGDSTEQYRHFVKHFPLLAQQVPLKYIASYLRITQSSLSRIRRQFE